jgi:hypothetical protein
MARSGTSNTQWYFLYIYDVGTDITQWNKSENQFSSIFNSKQISNQVFFSLSKYRINKWQVIKLITENSIALDIILQK